MGVAVVESASICRDVANIKSKRSVQATIALHALHFHVSVVALQRVVCESPFFDCNGHVLDLNRASVDLDACRMPRYDQNLPLGR